MIKVAIVDDDVEWVKIIQKKLLGDDDLLVAWYAHSGEHALVRARQNQDTDVILMDIHMNGQRYNGIKSAVQIREISGSRIIMLSSMTDTETIRNAITAEIDDFLSKNDLDELASRIKKVYRTDSYMRIASSEIKRQTRELMLKELSPAEREVFDHLNAGECQKELLTRLNKSPNTLKAQIKGITSKLQVKDMKAAIHKIRTLGLMDIPDDEQPAE